ncbi:MAG: hypothetical protein WAN03_10130 [Candidatus Sulfotelmatobacter sp.]
MLYFQSLTFREGSASGVLAQLANENNWDARANVIDPRFDLIDQLKIGQHVVVEFGCSQGCGQNAS